MPSAIAVKTPVVEHGALKGDEPGDLGLRAWQGLLRVHACLAKRLDAELERAHGLQASSFEVLDHLASAQGARMRMCDLAERARLSRSGLTRLVDRLERDGLLQRCSCDHDARGSFACLTSEGHERLERARATHMAVVRQHFLAPLADEDLRALASAWARIAHANGC
jgi:DNA-binding MarR family transcriptional regulator